MATRSFEVLLGDGWLAFEQPIDEEQDQGADQRCDEACALSFLLPADDFAHTSAKQRTFDADQHGDNDAAWILARHDELGQSADDEPDDRLPQQMEHVASPNGLPAYKPRRIPVRSMVSLFDCA